MNLSLGFWLPKKGRILPPQLPGYFMADDFSSHWNWTGPLTKVPWIFTGFFLFQ
jgi:hypothetical protein